MLPIAQHRPPGLLRVRGGLDVTLYVVGDLVRPILGVGGRPGVVSGASVPEAAVDEHGNPALRTHSVGGVLDGYGPDSALRWLSALRTICGLVTRRGRAPAVRWDLDLSPRVVG